MAFSVMEHAKNTQEESKPNTKTLTMIGFKVLLSWHYLVLFSPLFIGSITETSLSYFGNRQLTIYLTLAASFAILVAAGRLFLKKNKTTPSPVLMGCAGALATVATVLSVMMLNSDTPWRLATVVLLGFSEAFLMFLWLHYYTEAAKGHLFRSFAVDMMFGGVIAFLVQSLTLPLDFVIAACMPGVATVSLIAKWRTVEPVQVVEQSVPHASSMRKSIMRHSLKTLLPTTVYAFVFGLLQGSFLSHGVALLMAGNALVLIGIVIAGAIIFFIREAPGTNADIDTIHRFSLLFFVLGIVGLSFFGGGGGGFSLLASETAIIAGFNLFDFGGLILGVGLARRLKPGSLLLVDGGRVLVYVSLALGLVSGHFAMTWFGGVDSQLVLYSLCGVAITLLVATVLTPFREQESFEAQFMRTMADESSISPYHDIITQNAGATDGASGLSAVMPQGAAALVNQQESVATAPVPCTSDTKPARQSKLTRSEPKRQETPWRRTCQGIAELYKLSPRETEIFFLIAKGRNAEYVQQQLVISLHTAKTHIANIYHKLGVHSLQEMLSLIETFREEDKKTYEKSLQ